MTDFTTLDAVAVTTFVVLWIAFSWYADRPDSARPAVNKIMQEHRTAWMRNLVKRELKVIDTTIQSSLLNGVAFFASTSILLVGGSLSVLGATDRALAVVQYLPFAQDISRSLWEVKVFLLVAIFTYAFFKFTWCYRLFIYCVVLMGAAPTTDALADDEDRDAATEKATAFADRISDLHGIGAKHFNRGLRAYMYGLAAIAWFVHPGLLIVASVWVTVVLFRREFASKSLSILSDV